MVHLPRHPATNLSSEPEGSAVCWRAGSFIIAATGRHKGKGGLNKEAQKLRATAVATYPPWPEWVCVNIC